MEEQMDRRKLCKLGLVGIGSMAFSRSAHAMKMFTAAEEKKWAIVYGTQCGSTEEYANFINKGLGEIADVINIDSKTPAVDEYDYFVIGGWRNASSLKPAKISEFITANKAALKDKIKGLFVVLGNGGKAELTADQTSFLNSKLVTPLGVSNSVPAKILYGRHRKACDNLTSIQDYDNVSEEKGVAFGESILSTALSAHRSAISGNLHIEEINVNRIGTLTPVRYSIPQAAYVELTIWALSGQKLATLVSAHQQAGNYSIKWDVGNFAPGQYLFQLKANGITETRTVRLLAY